VRLPFTDIMITVCETQEAIQTRTNLRQTDRDNQSLSQRIRRLERELGDVICEAEPPPPPPPPPPSEPETHSGLDPNAFEEGDISIMEGCWELTSDYTLRLIETGEELSVNYWRICFDANGQGRQTMRLSGRRNCEGSLTGRLSNDGKLIMREPGNLQCTRNTMVLQRETTCTLDQDGRALCKALDLETRSGSNVTLRRARD